MGKVVEKKKKKKGRPSLLDIQKRNLKLQNQEQIKTTPTSNPNPNFKNSKSPISRRFTRRNPNPDSSQPASDDDDENAILREKKLNHVLRMPSNHRSSGVNSPYLDLGLYGSDSNEEDEEEIEEEEEEDEKAEEEESPVLKKRKINAANAAATNRSAQNSAKKGEKQKSPWKATEKQPQQLQQKQHHHPAGTPLDSGPTTPLPDKKLLVFILDRLQKKDTYGVYAEPVDPDELPDYHEIIENPMDFSTVRKKLENGAYANLEQFESDVFLICSNAMQYNEPTTIYFRQARKIQELAKRDFENLRHDSDKEEKPKEEKPKIVRRGRPPTKHLKAQLAKTSSEHGQDATPIKQVDLSNTYNLRRGHIPERYFDGSRRNSRRNSESYSWLSEHKSEKSDEYSGSSMKGFSMKYGKKNSILDETRRNTYMNSHPSVVGSESSVLNTFDGEIKQLLPVGLHMEFGYARSLARFAANLGPIAWKVASEKIKRALPPGMKFGPGWVGDDEAPLPETTPSSSSYPLLSQPQVLSAPMVESKGDLESLDGYPNRTTTPAIASCSNTVIRSETIEDSVEALNRPKDGGTRPPPFQILHQSSVVNPGMNGFNVSTQMGKVVRPGWSGPEPSVNSRILDMVSKSNFMNSMPGSGAPSTIIADTTQAQTCWNGLILPQKPESIPPDLNVRFQSPGSPSCSVRVDSPHPDLALQL